MKKVYFACSISSGGDTSQYQHIVDAIKAAGDEVMSEIFVNDAILYGGSQLPKEDIYIRDIGMINQCDVVIAEVSSPSLGVGYELAYAEKLNKPILCLFNKASPRRLSSMISGNPYMQLAAYSDEKSITDSVKSFLTD